MHFNKTSISLLHYLKNTVFSEIFFEIFTWAIFVYLFNHLEKYLKSVCDFKFVN